MKITKTSQLTGKIHTLDINITESELMRIENRRASGELIQRIVPNLPMPDREFLMTGITNEEWIGAFGQID